MPAKNLKCPKCATVVVVPEGQKPVCSNCGFGSAQAAPAAQPSFGQPSYGQPPAQAYGYGAPAGYAAPASQRPGMVTAVAVLQFIAAGLLALFGVIVLVGGLFFATVIAELIESSGAPGASALAGGAIMVVAIVVAVLALGFATLYFFSGRGLLAGRGYGRVIAIVLAALMLVNYGLSLIQGDLSTILMVGVNVFVLVAMLVPSTSQWFRAKASQPKGAPHAYG